MIDKGVLWRSLRANLKDAGGTERMVKEFGLFLRMRCRELKLYEIELDLLELVRRCKDAPEDQTPTEYIWKEYLKLRGPNVSEKTE